MPYVPPHRRRQLEAEAASAPVAPPVVSGGELGDRPLLILDVNNVLLCRRPFGSSQGGSQYRLRRHCNEFLRFCFEHFAVAVWSCGRRDTLLAELGEIEALRELGARLLFVWSQEHSTNLWPRHSAVSEQKPLFLKEIGKVFATDSRFSPRNTILIDDHAEKFERNPLGSCVVVPAFRWEQGDDDECLAANGELVSWLLRLAQADDTSALVRASREDSALFPTSHPAPPPEPEPEPEQGTAADASQSQRMSRAQRLAETNPKSQPEPQPELESKQELELELDPELEPDPEPEPEPD